MITRYDDIVAVEKNKRRFINSGHDKNGYRPNIGADQSIIGNDDPLHQARRSLVSRRFTPRAVQQWQGHITEAVEALLDPVIERGRAEIVSELAAPLPAKMIGFLLGFDDDLWPELKHWSEATIAMGGGPRYHTHEGTEAVMDFVIACSGLYESKQACPAGDVMSRWIKAEDDGDGLVGGSEFGLDQIISDCLLLLDGGAETTRTVIGRTLLELADRPEAWATLKAGADLEIAVEEFIRWVTPIHNMCRSATADTELHGRVIRKGDQLILMYPSANRDPRRFDDPETYDVTPQPQPPHRLRLRHPLLLGRSPGPPRDPDLLRAPAATRRPYRAHRGRPAGGDAQRLRLRPPRGPPGLRRRLSVAPA